MKPAVKPICSFVQTLVRLAREPATLRGSGILFQSGGQSPESRPSATVIHVTQAGDARRPLVLGFHSTPFRTSVRCSAFGLVVLGVKMASVNVTTGIPSWVRAAFSAVRSCVT